MSHIALGRTVLEALSCLAGLLNLCWTFTRRRSAAEMRGCLFAGAALFLFAGALWAQSARHNGIALTTGLLSIASGITWFCHIYKQSLHNTAM